MLAKAKINATWSYKTNPGRSINVEFIGTLREEQPLATQEMIKHGNNIIVVSTAFGETVIAAKLVAERKVNILILVHRQQLLSQLVDRLAEFLKIDEELPAVEKRRG